jgi:hypothetical protein
MQDAAPGGHWRGAMTIFRLKGKKIKTLLTRL